MPQRALPLLGALTGPVVRQGVAIASGGAITHAATSNDMVTLVTAVVVAIINLVVMVRARLSGS